MEVSKGSINSTKGANYHLFDSIEDRDNLPQHQRMIGIKCYVITENKEYQLINGIENSNWQLTSGDTSNNLSISTDKVIYVETTGNDLTGDGTQTLPYQTLERGLLDLKGLRINDGVTVTIQLGFGSFQFSDNCKEIIETIRFQSTEATLFIQGSYSELSDIALTPTSDPFVYEASISGALPNWTNDEFKFSFFQTGTNINSHLFPISSNTSNTIETFPDLTSGSIIKLETSLDMMGNKFALDFMNPHIKTTIRTYSMAISLINLANMPSHFELNSSMALIGCHIETLIMFRIYSDVYLSACSFQSSVNINGQARMLRRLFISGNYIDGVLNIHNSDIAIRGFIIEVNPGGNVGYFSKYSTVGNNNFTGKAFAFKIKNAPIAFRLHQAAFNSGVDEIILQNSEHFLEISSEPVFLDLPELMNSTPNSGYFTNTNKLIDLQTGTRINIPGLYPEYDSQQKLIVTVTNPTTLIIGNNSFNSFIEFEYTALRGILTPISGVIHLTLASDEVYLIRNEQYGEDIGLNFTTNLNSGNSQLVELVLTALDNEYDDNIIVNYKIKRLMQ